MCEPHPLLVPMYPHRTVILEPINAHNEIILAERKNFHILAEGVPLSPPQQLGHNSGARQGFPTRDDVGGRWHGLSGKLKLLCQFSIHKRIVGSRINQNEDVALANHAMQVHGSSFDW